MRITEWQLVKKHKQYGCKVCKHNPVGICELCGREVPMRLVIQNGTPKWCPKQKGVKK